MYIASRVPSGSDSSDIARITNVTILDEEGSRYISVVYYRIVTGV